MPKQSEGEIDADRFPAQNRGMGTLYSGDILFQVFKLLLDAVFGQNIDSQVPFRHTHLRNG